MPLSRSLLAAKQPNMGKFAPSALRQELNLSQKKFAAKLGVTFPTLNRWENQSPIPDPLIMHQINSLLNDLGERGVIIRTTLFPEKG